MTLRNQAGERRLQKLIDRGTSRLVFPRAGRVEGRNTDGTTRLRFLDGSCEARLGITGARTGEVVLAEPTTLRTRGTAGVPVASLIASRTSLWVERLEPSELCAGQEQVATVIGRGFNASTRFEFLLPDSAEIHPGISILEQSLIDAEHVELRLVVDAESPLFEAGPLAYG